MDRSTVRACRGRRINSSSFVDTRSSRHTRRTCTSSPVRSRYITHMANFSPWRKLLQKNSPVTNYIILSLFSPIVALVLQMPWPSLAHLPLPLWRSTTALSVTYHPVSGISSQGTSPAYWLITLIWSYTRQFVISFITTVNIHYSFSLPLQAQNSYFPQILSSIVLLPFHPPHWLHGLQLFFVFLGHVSFNFGIVC